jgi:hypothetical protein
MPLPGCHPGPDNVADWQKLLPGGLSLTQYDPSAEVELSETGADVDLSYLLRFHFDAKDQATCWNMVIFVD